MPWASAERRQVDNEPINRMPCTNVWVEEWNTARIYQRISQVSWHEHSISFYFFCRGGTNRPSLTAGWPVSRVSHSQTLFLIYIYDHMSWIRSEIQKILLCSTLRHHGGETRSFSSAVRVDGARRDTSDEALGPTVLRTENICTSGRRCCRASL